MNDNTSIQVNEKLAQMWLHILGIPSVEHDDNFFSQGGHSLLAIELLSEIAEQFKIHLNIKDFIEHPTLLQLSNLIHKKEVNEQDESLKAEQIPSMLFHPLSLNQKQVWSLNALYPNSTSHNISTALRIKKELDEKVINQTINYIVSRQEALRTCFKRVNGKPVQEIIPEVKYDIKIQDIDEESLEETLKTDMAHSFNLESDPLMKIKFYRLGPEDYVFFFMVHHIVWDGLSSTMFFHEFNLCYDAFLANKIPSLTPVQVTLKEYAQTESRYFETEEYKTQELEWKKAMSAPLPLLKLPTDFPRSAKTGRTLETLHFEIESDLLQKTETYAKKNHLSLYQILTTIYKIVLSKVTGDLELIIGTPVHGRKHGTRKTFGYFINTLPLRTHLVADQSFKENMSRVLETIKFAFYNQNVPTDIIIKNAEMDIYHKAHSLYQTLFVYLDVTKELDQFNALNLEQVKIKRTEGHTDIDFYLYKSRNKIEGVVEFKKDLFLKERIEDFVSNFKDILNRVLSDDQITLLDLGVVPNTSSSAPKLLRVEQNRAKEAQTLNTSKTAVEVSGIWQTVLGINDIGPDEDFFDVGGHSILAVEIFEIISEKYKLNLSISTIFSNLTINSLSLLIDNELSNKHFSLPTDLSSFKSLVAIKKSTDNGAIVFCFHGVGGNVLNYYPLAKLMGEKSFFGVQAIGVNEEHTGLKSIPEMANFYISEILKIQPTGPYILAGGSMGGMIALEVALQLKGALKEVSEVVMLDTFGPHLDEDKFGKIGISFIQRIRESLSRMKVDALMKLKVWAHALSKREIPHLLRYHQVEKVNYQALKQYTPQSYDGNVTLIRAHREPQGWYADPLLGWGDYLKGRLNVIEVDGNHENLIESASLGKSFQETISRL